MNLPFLSISDNIEYLLSRKQAFVFYNKANSNKVKALFQNDSKLYTTKNYKEQGFVFAPFDNQQDAILIPSGESTLLGFDLSVVEGDIETIPFDAPDVEKIDYLNLINKTVDFIHSRKADKVVITRRIDKEYKKEHVGLIYENLLQVYTNAYVYVWYHPKVGLWMGATPERLLCVQKDAFCTMALAGTQLHKENIIWKIKEKDEQQWVTDFITDQLIPISEHLEISKPYTHRAGHLAHLRTDIKGYFNKVTSLRNLIARLHPTPAVCGTPRNTAKKFILENENYNRKFYTGFLGELNLHQQTDLYVNLRCMELNDTHVNLYIGGGITKDSSPEKEWDETVNKAAVLGKFLV